MTTARLARYRTVADTLAVRSDKQLVELLDATPITRSGIGGTARVLDVDAVRVFAKRIPLTDVERAHPHSTANLFGLATHWQYGINSPGFGAWRELAANVITTDAVLTGASGAFPLLYHWRVLPGTQPAPTDPMHPALRPRLDAITNATAGIVLFLEHIPQTLRAFLDAHGPDAADWLEERLHTDIPALNATGLLHFDAHPGNILTDGERLYIADLGLATSPRFDLDADEAAFVDAHRDHDLGYAAMVLVNWLVSTVDGHTDAATRHARIDAYAAGAPCDSPVIRRHAPAAAVMNAFYRRLFAGDHTAPYPQRELAAALGKPAG
ncbi:hypothetical protein Val02_24590 [Virgisporangium aliadipatigenens]|uniref:Uncharacterized protein n=1 Tax=Virgisporangium aliadipatigenens TaxID=741659 RepID=A0A8J3YK53_9ACTN|nr:serine/threonine protein phosphatase [Virgisporangium aliadipatigenens]GIJ45573.1 hypothetical protein Val02_24590 [Virgisporangium aliadipatigenens]